MCFSVGLEKYDCFLSPSTDGERLELTTRRENWSFCTRIDEVEKEFEWTIFWFGMEEKRDSCVEGD